MKTTILIIKSLVALTMVTSAQVYNFSFDSSNSAQGAIIEGYIDINTDDLFVTSWTDAAGGITSWTPASSELPLVFSAHVPGIGGVFPGAAYDITSITPGAFNFDNGAFAFYSDKTNSEINWNEGTFLSSSLRTVISTDNASNPSTNSASISVVPTAPDQNAGYGGVMTVTPVPEPSTSILLALGSLSIITRRKR